MKIILAQGNPEPRYDATRHNIGFYLLDALAQKYKATFQEKSKFHALVAQLDYDGEKILLVKPATYYNETGVSARALVDFYKLSLDDLLVIHDDLSLPFGQIKTRLRGSSAGNNGIKSLNTHLGEHYARIRVGVYNTQRDSQNDVGFVLSRFSPTEAALLPDIAKQVMSLAEAFLANAFTATTLKLETINPK